MRRRIGLTAAALFLVVFGARAWLVGQAGSSLPQWDQWWSDVHQLVLPLAEGRLHWQNVTAPHNEHRLVGERLLTLAQVAISGRYDPWDGLVLSAAVRALGLAFVFVLLSRGQSRPIRGTLFVLLAALGALPVGTFNLLSAFQVQFFLCEPLTVAAAAVLCGAALTAGSVALGGLLLAAALLTMASPMIAAGALAAVLAFRAALGGKAEPGVPATAAWLAALAAYVFVSTQFVHSFGARSTAEFARSLVRILAWPFPDVPALALLPLVPPALLALRLVREKTPPGHAWFVLALCATALLQATAIAYARGGLRSEYPQYVDGLWLGQVAGFAALVEALRPLPNQAPRWRSSVLLLWAAWLGTSLIADASLRGVPTVQAVARAVALREPRFAEALRTGRFGEFEAEVGAVREMLVASDTRFFDHPAGRFAIPPAVYPELVDARERLLPWFPASLAGAPPSWTSRGLRALSRLGPLVSAVGLLLAAAAWRRDPEGERGVDPRAGAPHSSDAG